MYSTEQIISICGCHGYHEAYLRWILQQNVLPFSEILTKLICQNNIFISIYYNN